MNKVFLHCLHFGKASVNTFISFNMPSLTHPFLSGEYLRNNFIKLMDYFPGIFGNIHLRKYISDVAERYRYSPL